tara:strand:- start:1322 stop:1480 length:159 start_codon:yes stop_codon:yes gene_type:complete
MAGCGCGKKRSSKKISNSKKTITKKSGNAIRKKRLTKLVSNPGRVASKPRTK